MEWLALVSVCAMLAAGFLAIVRRSRTGESAVHPLALMGLGVAAVTVVAATVPSRLALQLGAALLPLGSLSLAALAVKRWSH